MNRLTRLADRLTGRRHLAARRYFAADGRAGDLLWVDLPAAEHPAARAAVLDQLAAQHHTMAAAMTVAFPDEPPTQLHEETRLLRLLAAADHAHATGQPWSPTGDPIETNPAAVATLHALTTATPAQRADLLATLTAQLRDTIDTELLTILTDITRDAHDGGKPA